MASNNLSYDQISIFDKENVLVDAVSKNNVELAEQLLNAGVNPNSRDEAESTLLMLAAVGQNIDIVRSLLAHDADINAVGGPYRETALMGAVRNLEIFKLILDAGADVNIPNISGDTVLMQLVIDDLESFVKLVLASGNCKLDLCNHIGMTALHFAVWNDQVKTAQLLLAAGADPRITGPHTDCVLMYSESSAMAELLLAAGCEPNHYNSKGHPCLYHAIANHLVGVAISIIKAGANLEYVVNDQTPLFHALTRWLPSIVEELVENGANVKATNSKNRGALFFAALQPDPFICRYLIMKGADPDLVDDSGVTPVYIAVARENIAVAKVLLERGALADREYRYHNGVATLLDMAIQQHLGDLASLLYDLGSHTTEQYVPAQSWPEEIQAVIHRMRQPRSLLDICRIRLRRHQLSELVYYLKSNLIPKTLEDYLLMPDRLL